MLKALIFDFDGLILDTETPEFRRWEEIYAGYGLTLPLDQWCAMVGRGTQVSEWTPYIGLEKHLGAIDTEAIRARGRARFAQMMEAETIRPGVMKLIDEASAHGMALAVASSSPHAWVDGYLRKLRIVERFAVVKCRDDVDHAKPAPDLYLAALDALQVRPDEAIALEDSPNGIAAAKAAGLYCIAAPNEITRRLDLSAADRIVESLAEVRLAEYCR